jgi:hypothetical protein
VIHVVQKVELDLPTSEAWEQLSNLEWLMRANVFHQRIRFVGGLTHGVGAKAFVGHGLPIGPLIPRIVRVTHWDEGRRIRWTDVDPKYPKYLFPHSEEFRLEPLSANACLLTDELRGTINLPGRTISGLVDRAFGVILAGWAVRRQCVYFRETIARQPGALVDVGHPRPPSP